MRPIKFVGATGKFIRPTKWPTDRPPCGTLHVMKSGDTNYSVWKPSWAQRMQILFGHCIVLGVMGTTHPPVSIGTSKATEIVE